MVVTRSARAVAATAVLLGTLGAGIGEARADTQAEQAQKLFDEGQELLRAGNVAGACTKLEESHKLEPLVGTLLNMAYCHERQGRVGLAWREYRLAAARAATEGQGGRTKFANERATAIEAKLVRARIVVPAGAQVRGIKIDGDPVQGDPTAVFLEKGRHVVDVRIKDGEGGEKTVVVDVKPGAGEVVVDASVTAPPPPPPERIIEVRTVTERDGSTQRIVGWSLVGLGVVGVGLGTYFGIRTLGEKSDAEAQCNGEVCTPAGKRAGDRAHDFALVSTIAFGVGIVGLGAGTYLVLSAPGAATVAGRF